MLQPCLVAVQRPLAADDPAKRAPLFDRAHDALHLRTRDSRDPRHAARPDALGEFCDHLRHLAATWRSTACHGSPADEKPLGSLGRWDAEDRRLRLPRGRVHF